MKKAGGDFKGNKRPIMHSYHVLMDYPTVSDEHLLPHNQCFTQFQHACIMQTALTQMHPNLTLETKKAQETLN